MPFSDVWRPREPSSNYILARETAFATLLVALGLIQTLGRHFRILLTPVEMDPDPRNAWHPIAQEVLSGTPLYVGPATHGKPPLLHLLNIAVAATGHYQLVFLLLVGLVNGVAAILLWQFLTRRYTRRIGIVAAILFLGTLPIVNGIHINNKSFAVMFILLALLQSQSLWAGGSLATAALFSRYAVFAIPVIAWENVHDRTGGHRRRWIAGFVAGGFGVVALSFALVGVVFGEEALVRAVELSLLLQAEGGPQSTPWRFFSSPVRYVGKIGRTATFLLHLVVPTAYYLARRRSDLLSREWNLTKFQTGLLVSMLLPFFTREYLKYWVLSLPYFAAFAALGISTFLEETGPPQEEPE